MRQTPTRNFRGRLSLRAKNDYCSLLVCNATSLDKYQRFGGTCHFRLQGKGKINSIVRVKIRSSNPNNKTASSSEKVFIKTTKNHILMLRPHRALRYVRYVCFVRYVRYVRYTKWPHWLRFVQDTSLAQDDGG